MRLAHFIITRFCLRDRRWMEHVDGPWFGAVNPVKARNLNLRLRLLEAVCLPALQAQTNQNFTWVLLVDVNLDGRTKRRLRDLTRGLSRVRLHEHHAGAPARLERLGWLRCLRDRPDFVLTTLNDDDDALPRRFVETVQSHIFELDGKGGLPPFKIMGTKRALRWRMAFTPSASLGWASVWRERAKVPSCGFSLLCRQPGFDFSVLGMRHIHAESYFDSQARPPARNVLVYRRLLLEAARDARVGRIPMNAEAFFDASAAGTAVISSHEGNLNSWRWSSSADPDRRPVLGAETFPDVRMDWDAVRRHAKYFGGWRPRMRRLESALYGPKGVRIEAAHRFMKRLRRRPARFNPAC